MKLQTRLLLVIIPVLVVAMVALGRVAYVQLQTTSETELLMRMQLLLEQTGNSSGTMLETLEANARLFASSNLIERYVRVEDEAERYDLLQPALLKLFATYRRAYPDYREIRLLLPDGFEDTRLASSEMPNRTEDEGVSDWFRRARSDATYPFSSAVIEHPDSREYSLVVTRPIWLIDNNLLSDWSIPRLRGYLSVTLRLEALLASIREARIGKTGTLLLLHRDGRLLAGGMPDAAARAVTPADSRRLVAHFSAPDTAGVEIPFTMAETPSLVNARWLHPDLLLLAVLPKAEFFATSARLAVTVAAVTLMAILLASTVLFLFLRTLVLRPVSELRRAAIAIGEGRSDSVQLPVVRRSDELGDLAQAFQYMQERLSHSMRELTESHARIEQLAYRDTLTQLPNRRLLIDMVSDAIARTDVSDHRVAMLFLDLDEFKKVNDSEGHDAGDRLLQEVADRLQTCSDEMHDCRVDTTGNGSARRPAVARIGGDEFVVLLDGLSSRDDATSLARRIVAAIARPVTLGDNHFVVGTSIGISHWPDHATDVDELIKCADMAMYEAKQHGKNTWRHYGSDMQAVLKRRLALENDLRQAVPDREMFLEYQPQYATRDRAVMGVEALLRWNHPAWGMVRPDEFVAVAEDIGLIDDIGCWVLEQACRQWRQWCDAGLPPMRMAVNVSRRQLSAVNFAERVAEAIHRFRVQPACLEIELTETCMMEAPADAVVSLQAIRALGVRVAMDDFGTGYSSLAALTALPIDTLKIDRSFITGITPETENDKVVSAILTLAHSLRLEIIAEGVETEAEMRFLTERHCDIVQGYLLSGPLSAADISALLASPHADAA